MLSEILKPRAKKRCLPERSMCLRTCLCHQWDWNNGLWEEREASTGDRAVVCVKAESARD